MCLAIPVKIKKLKDEIAISEEGKEVDISLVSDELKEGDYLLVHDNLAINTLAKEEAEKIIGVVSECSHSHS